MMGDDASRRYLLTPMKGQHKFAPRSGAALDREPEYPGTIPLREALDGSGELSNGTLVSESGEAIVRYFRRCHQRHHDEAPDCYAAAALAVKRLRAEDPWDVWVWYALAERLHRKGYDVAWMFAHAEPRCPRCSSRLQFDDAAAGYPYAKCGASCSPQPDRTIEIHERVEAVYETAFDEDLDGFEAW